MANTYTVKKGDTLSALAVKFGTTVAKLVELNDIANPDYIVVGQVLKLNGETSTPATNKTSKPTIKLFGLQSNTERTIYATWTWSKDNTENYRYVWYYDTGDEVWFVGDDSTTEFKQSTYNAPSNAKRVKFKVKPISKTRLVNNKETSYWTAAWSTEEIYTFSTAEPEVPSSPRVEIDKYTLTVELENVQEDASRVQFQIVRDNESIFKTGTSTVKTRHASYSCTVDAGSEYKVRCRAYIGNTASKWSEYSDNVITIPSAPDGFTICRANSSKSIYLEWKVVNTAENYEIQYAKKKEYFDNAGAVTTQDTEYTHYEIFFDSGSDGIGSEYFFRLRAVNEKGESPWSSIASTSIGKKPAAPTTWSSTTTVTTGDPLTLYWMHNAEDGSSQTYAELELIVNNDSVKYDIAKGKHTLNVLVGGISTTITVEIATDEDDNDKTSTCVVNTKPFVEGTAIQWRVRTAGVTKEYGEQSIQRTVDVYAPPTLELHMFDTSNKDIEVLKCLPFRVRGLAGPKTQTPIGYHLSVVANSAYETVDQIGNVKMVSKGDQVYSKYFDINGTLNTTVSAGDIDLENNVKYTTRCVVSMNSGLTAESIIEFKVSWDDLEYEPNAEIAIDEETLTANIAPYCDGETGMVTLSVYRREFDGSFTEIATGIENGSNTFVTDPHPALDYARYRIVAIDESTGAVSYYDMPGYPIGEKAAVIQWDEAWTSFDVSEEEELEEPAWAGSMLKLPYNIDVSDKRNVDVALVEYIGRAHPISYYGTQLGESSTWSMEVPKYDKETLYALRRLSVWKGDVYVREPSGSGYWANVVVSFSQKHCEVTIPVTLDITRVEGGM